MSDVNVQESRRRGSKKLPIFLFLHEYLPKLFLAGEDQSSAMLVETNSAQMSPSVSKSESQNDECQGMETESHPPSSTAVGNTTPFDRFGFVIGKLGRKIFLWFTQHCNTFLSALVYTNCYKKRNGSQKYVGFLQFKILVLAWSYCSIVYCLVSQE